MPMLLGIPGNLKSTHISDFLSGRDLITTANDAVVGNLDAVKAYSLVAWLFRGVNIRARLVARFPYAIMRGETDVTDAPELATLVRQMTTLLYRTEASLLLTGAAYWLLDANQFGRNLTPRWILSATMKPVIDREQGLTGFRRYSSQPPEVPLDRAVYFWEPSFTAEIGPGVGAAQVALGPASQLYAMDAFAAQFFNRGAVKVTVFEVPHGMPEGDKQDFQNFLNRALSGVRQAFRNIAVRGGIKPTVVGSSIKETQAPELIALQRDNVAAALEIPPSVIDGTSANFATAQSDYFGFITGTIIPRVEWLYEIINAQYLNRFGAEIVPQPEKLEIMQSAQLQQAQAVSLLVPGQAVLTLDEARAYLDLEPLSPKPAPVSPPAAVVPPAAPSPPPDVAASMHSWRRTHLDAIARGAYYSAQPFKAMLPPDLYESVAEELETARTARDARAAFERHWPRSAERDGIAELTAEIRAARLALANG